MKRANETYQSTNCKVRTVDCPAAEPTYNAPQKSPIAGRQVSKTARATNTPITPDSEAGPEHTLSGDWTG